MAGITREELRKHINDNCIIRVPEGSQELPNMEGNGFYDWQFYLRPAILDQRSLSYIAGCFWAKFYEAYHKQPFQIAGLESASISIITAILMWTGAPGNVHAFAVRKERKKYGLGNVIEGIPSSLPVLFVDDLTSPKHYAFWKTVRALSEHKLRLYPHAFVVVRKQYKQIDPNIATSIGITRVESIFTLDDFDLERDDPELRAEFDRCWPWLEASIERYGHTHEKKDIWNKIIRGQALFWPGEKCAILTEFLDYPTGLRRFNLWLRGGDLKEILQLTDSIEEWADQQGCHEIIGRGRKGWLRKEPDYEATTFGRRKVLRRDAQWK